MGYFPVDEESCNYLLATGRSPAHVDAFRAYYKAQNLFGIPKGGECDYSAVLATGVLVLLGIALSNSWQLVISHESDDQSDPQ
jgi:hypothetical protein